MTHGGMMRTLLLASLLLSTPALADDKAACADGIAMIRDALAQNPPEAALPKLRKALRVAEREQGEGEFDECLDAVGEPQQGDLSQGREVADPEVVGQRGVDLVGTVDVAVRHAPPQRLGRHVDEKVPQFGVVVKGCRSR